MGSYRVTLTQDALHTLSGEIIANSAEEAEAAAIEMEERGDFPSDTEDIEGNGDWIATAVEL